MTMKKGAGTTPSSTKRGRDGPTVESHQARGPCPECGAITVNVWKGGGYNMGTKVEPAKDKDVRKEDNTQDNYIKSLQQQIKILELEIAYLKKQIQNGTKESRPTVEIPSDSRKAEEAPGGGQEDLCRKLKEEILSHQVKMEQLRMEKAKLANRIKAIEGHREEEKEKQMETIARLTGKVEQLEQEMEQRDQRIESTFQDLEKQTIISKDREKRILQLMEEVECKTDSLTSNNQQLDQLQAELSGKNQLVQQLQDKFLQSSAHIMQETIKGLQEELKIAHAKLKEAELVAEEWKQVREKSENVRACLVEENADLKAQLAETRAELQGEVRTREHRESRVTLDSQELAISKEKEAQLRLENKRIQQQLDKQLDKNKQLSDKLSSENQLVTTHELRMATQKSRILELEGSLSLANENTNNIRKRNLLHLDKIENLKREVEQRQEDVADSCRRLADTQAKLVEKDRRIEELVEMQSARWDEFCKMADNMKNLSSNMLQQSQTNKNAEIV